MLDHAAQGRHHRHAAMLELGGAEVAETVLVALLAEAGGVKV
eukprot:CAMPEP_0183499648 /NCGR_PEP_ID=MMETSP0371-20130417/1863_1 /TAXON_ID=268820 /ORGANISM="Peridinium aciculiferum, Strain PAER-2" /LENGTH=41 /DNA_ID= /DNA_START= /DNA_END= /DNA_ORIENTATION=